MICQDFFIGDGYCLIFVLAYFSHKCSGVFTHRRAGRVSRENPFAVRKGLRRLVGSCCRVVLTVTGHKAQHEAHDEHHGVQTVSGMQRRQRAAVRNNRARDHEGQHGADGAAGQHEVHQLR